MKSIYEQALGEVEFQRLHPKMQERFGFSSQDQIACFGTGTMQTIWHGPFYVVPFLYLGVWRRILFPEYGVNVPFTIANYAYLDSFGRETVSWIRTFQTSQTRRFDAYMIYSQQYNKIVDYLGTHQHLVVDIDVTVDDRGGLRIRSSRDRIFEGVLKFGLPHIFHGIADVYEYYDDEKKAYRIEVNVSNPLVGKLFGYRGWFTTEMKSVLAKDIPLNIKPMREEPRE